MVARMEWEPPVAPGQPPPPPTQPPPGYEPPRTYPNELEFPPGTWRGQPLAGWWYRVAAALLDGLIVGIPATAVVLAIDPAIGVLIWLTATLTYYPLLMMRQGAGNGQTFGKQIVGIRVVRESGEPYTYGPAALREFVIKYLLFGVVGGFFLAIPTLLDYLWPLWDEQNRALHDMLASSRVVQA